MAVHADDAPSLATEFTARIFWLGRTPLAAGKRYKLKLVTQEVECEIKTLEEVVDASTVQTIPGADSVRTNDAAKVIIHTRRPVAIDLFERVPTLGRLVLVDGFDVAGGGIVVEIPERFAAANVVADAGVNADVSQVARGERHLRHGHRGAVVWLTGVPGSGKTTFAKSLERHLFERHIQVFVLDGENIRPGLSSDLGVSGSDREENMRRVAEVAKLFAEAGSVCIVSFTSPTRAERERARRVDGRRGRPEHPVPRNVSQHRERLELAVRAAGTSRSDARRERRPRRARQPRARAPDAADSIACGIRDRSKTLQSPGEGQDDDDDQNQPDGTAANPRPSGVKSSTTQHDEQNNQYQQ